MDEDTDELDQVAPPSDAPDYHEPPQYPQQGIPPMVSEGMRSTQLKTLLSWVAPGRPFRKRGREYFVNILVIALAIEIILFLFSQYMLMVLVASLVFLTFTLATVPPHPFHYKISTQGITVEDHFYLWQELYDFYFKKQDNVELLIVRTKAYFPGELAITLGDMHKEHIKTVLLPYLPYREYVQPSLLERSSDWLGKTFPLEKQKHPVQPS